MTPQTSLPDRRDLESSSNSDVPGPALSDNSSPPAAGFSQRLWRLFCTRTTDIFYRDNEEAGLEHLPESGPVILAANHVNALVDALVVQSTIPRPVHPVARSGLFRNPLLRPILSFIQAVPIQRRKDSIPIEPAAHEPPTDEPPTDEPGADKPATAKPATSNDTSFETLYRYLAEGRVILIFPEGQSHSDPSLRPLKTGAARLALGHLQRTGVAPKVIPVGLTFTHKGRFRSDVLVQVGPAVAFTSRDGESSEDAVRRYTEEILDGLRQVTLNVESWQDLSLMKLMQQFFALRQGRGPDALPGRPTLAQRFRSFQRLNETHRTLRDRFPERVEALRTKLQHFQRLCQRYGIRDYQLELRYTPGVVVRFLLRSFFFLVFILPPTLWGWINSAIPYFATLEASRRSARGRDQYDTAGVLFGLLFFALFWGAQTFAVYTFLGLWPAVAYAASLPLSSMIALRVGHERHRILEEMRVFFLFARRRSLQGFLRAKREELEVELARMARLAKNIRQGKITSKKRQRSTP